MASLSSASFFLKAIALLVFIGGIAAATVGVQHVMTTTGSPLVVAAQGLRIEGVHPLLNATPGHQVTFDVSVTNRGDVARTLNASVTGAGVSGSAPAAIVPVGSNVTFFVTVRVPDDIAVGLHDLRATVATPDGLVTRSRDDALKLRILPAAPGYDNANSRASALYVGRLASTGKVFSTNDPALLATNFPTTETYGPSRGELPVEAATQLVDGIIEGVTGMQAGESRSFTFGPEKGYGNATTIETVPRIDVRDREYSLPIRTEQVGRASFDSFINDSEQGDPKTYKVGDTFLFREGANSWPYKILIINNTGVAYRLSAVVGENYTLYPFWVNASRVVSVNESTVRFQTTPSTTPNDNFSYFAYWPGMSQLYAYNATSIQIKHTPPVGFKYTIPATQFAVAVDATVHAVKDDAIEISVPSDNPLAGQSLTFDVYFLSLTK